MPPTSLIYTPATANAALPYVRRVVADLVRDHASWRASAAALAAAADDVAAATRATPDTPAVDLPALRRQVAHLAEDVRGALAELATLGVECKGLDVGLIDFPAFVDGMPAYLCWQLGEPSVAWWHWRDAGFAGRQLIADVAVPAAAVSAAPEERA